jgi:hypothetical protein
VRLTVLFRRIVSVFEEENNRTCERTRVIEMELYRRLLWIVAIVTCVSFSSSIAFATQTSQMWDFLDDTKGPMPADIDDNPFGTPQLRVATNGLWLSTDGDHTGVWQITGEMDIVVPNYQDIAREKKEIALTLTWKAWGQDSFIPDQPLVGLVPDYGLPMDYSLDVTRADTAVGDGWYTTLFSIDVYPNPLNEWISVKGDILVDKVIVDTVCVPEPFTAAVLAFGAMMVLGGKTREVRKKNTD